MDPSNCRSQIQVGFERFQEANRIQIRSFCGFGMDPSNFRMKIHEISALAAKRYLNVSTKRSGRENRGFSQSVTWTCSKRDFSSIFVGYSSRIFDDFHGFSQISSFLHIVLNASRRQIYQNTFILGILYGSE